MGRMIPFDIWEGIHHNHNHVHLSSIILPASGRGIQLSGRLEKIQEVALGRGAEAPLSGSVTVVFFAGKNGWSSMDFLQFDSWFMRMLDDVGLFFGFFLGKTMENPNISYDLRGLAWFSPKLSCYLDENERCWLKMSPGWCGKLFFVNHDAPGLKLWYTPKLWLLLWRIDVFKLWFLVFKGGMGWTRFYRFIWWSPEILNNTIHQCSTIRLLLC